MHPTGLSVSTFIDPNVDEHPRQCLLRLLLGNWYHQLHHHVIIIGSSTLTNVATESDDRRAIILGLRTLVAIIKPSSLEKEWDHESKDNGRRSIWL